MPPVSPQGGYPVILPVADGPEQMKGYPLTDSPQQLGFGTRLLGGYLRSLSVQAPPWYPSQKTGTVPGGKCNAYCRRLPVSFPHPRGRQAYTPFG